jgi:hypothetical protein
MLRRVFTFLIVLVAGLLVLGLLGLLFTVEDWSRDLTENVARTEPSAEDPALRPIYYSQPVRAVVRIVDGLAPDLPNWKLSGRTQGRTEVSYNFVVTSPWFGIEDDVTLTISESDLGPELGSVVNAESRSRSTGGDLGRNPRNLRELLEVIRKKLKE